MISDTIDNRKEQRKAQRRRINNRRRQQVRRQLLFLGTVIILVIMSVGSCTRNYIKEKRTQEAALVKKETSETKKKEKAKEDTSDAKDMADAKGAENEEKHEETPGERLTRVKQEAEAAGCPKEVTDLLAKNPETVDFVADYAAKKDIPPADTVGEVTAGTIPHLLQWDERWGYAPYGTSTVAVSGCGPTCMAMVISGLTGDASVTPAKVAAYSTENGYVDESNDTTWLFMEEAAQNWGVTGYEINLEETVVAEELQSGHPIICSVGPGDFTRNGHFIVLVGYDGGNIRIYDPFSRENSEKTWAYADISDQFQGLWAYSR